MNNHYQLPAGDPYLPPGCTQADIDRHFGANDDEETGECTYCGGTCRASATICRECVAQERAERRRDEEKDEPHHPYYDEPTN